jgi:hypothetical protein
LVGVIILSGTLVLTDALNPRGLLRDSSWFDPFFLPLSSIGVLLCIAAPFLSKRPIIERFGFSIPGLFGIFITIAISWAISTRLFGASLN